MLDAEETPCACIVAGRDTTTSAAVKTLKHFHFGMPPFLPHPFGKPAIVK